MADDNIELLEKPSLSNRIIEFKTKTCIQVLTRGRKDV